MLYCFFLHQQNNSPPLSQPAVQVHQWVQKTTAAHSTTQATQVPAPYPSAHSPIQLPSRLLLPQAQVPAQNSQQTQLKPPPRPQMPGSGVQPSQLPGVPQQPLAPLAGQQQPLLQVINSAQHVPPPQMTLPGLNVPRPAFQQLPPPQAPHVGQRPAQQLPPAQGPVAAQNIPQQTGLQQLQLSQHHQGRQPAVPVHHYPHQAPPRSGQLLAQPSPQPDPRQLPQASSVVQLTHQPQLPGTNQGQPRPPTPKDRQPSAAQSPGVTLPVSSSTLAPQPDSTSPTSPRATSSAQPRPLTTSEPQSAIMRIPSSKSG